jgi:hypothetical protein
VLLFKIVLAPVLIALVSLAGRKWGHGIAGWLLGLPLNSGPILFFILLEQGPQFAAQTANGGLLGIIAWDTFNIVYAYCCLRMNWWQSTLIGWLAYFVAAALLLYVKVGAGWAFLLTCVALALILWAFPRTQPMSEPVSYWRYDLILRMMTASAMVVGLTEFAKLLGPARSGILSAFPAYTTILAVFSHQHGAAAAINTLKGVAVGLYTAATFLLVLALVLSHLSTAAAFGLATVSALLVQMISLLHIRRTQHDAR